MVFAYRHKDRKEIYLIRTIIDDNGNAAFSTTTDPSLAIYAYSLDSSTYDYLVENNSEDIVVHTDTKVFNIDGYEGTLEKKEVLKLGDFEKIEYVEYEED